MCTTSVLRILMVINNLRHRCSHTACVNVTVRTCGILRAEGIIILSLVPGGGQQRSHNSVIASRAHRQSSLQPRPSDGRLCFGRDVLFHHRFDLFLVSSQPAAHMIGHVLHRKVVVVGVTQNRLHTLVSRHNYKAFRL